MVRFFFLSKTFKKSNRLSYRISQYISKFKLIFLNPSWFHEFAYLTTANIGQFTKNARNQPIRLKLAISESSSYFCVKYAPGRLWMVHWLPIRRFSAAFRWVWRLTDSICLFMHYMLHQQPEDWLLRFSTILFPFLSLASSHPDTHILTYQCELCQITSDQCHR